MLCLQLGAMHLSELTLALSFNNDTLMSPCSGIMLDFVHYYRSVTHLVLQAQLNCPDESHHLEQGIYGLIVLAAPHDQLLVWFIVGGCWVHHFDITASKR